MIFYYPLDEYIGDTIYDLSQNENHILLEVKNYALISWEPEQFTNEDDNMFTITQ